MSTSPTAIASRVVGSPIGAIRLTASPAGVREVWLGWEGGDPDGPSNAPPGGRCSGDDSASTACAEPRPVARPIGAADEVLDRLASQLDAFFAGVLPAFDIPLDAPGTPFQREVWAALLAIPAGQTRSYADVARAIGRPAAVRAVARANATNPVAILVPCHRVIGSDGSLTGYGGGLDRKRWLLDHERQHWGAGLFAGA